MHDRASRLGCCIRRCDGVYNTCINREESRSDRYGSSSSMGVRSCGISCGSSSRRTVSRFRRKRGQCSMPCASSNSCAPTSSSCTRAWPVSTTVRSWRSSERSPREPTSCSSQRAGWPMWRCSTGSMRSSGKVPASKISLRRFGRRHVNRECPSGWERSGPSARSPAVSPGVRAFGRDGPETDGSSDRKERSRPRSSSWQSCSREASSRAPLLARSRGRPSRRPTTPSRYWSNDCRRPRRSKPPNRPGRCSPSAPSRWPPASTSRPSTSASASCSSR